MQDRKLIEIIHPDTGNPLLETTNGLVDADGKVAFPYSNGAYRLVSDNNYTANFGKEWNTFAATQVDKHSSNSISEVRLFAQTKWQKGFGNGLNILEVGSGAGRFSQVILQHTQAHLYSVDYSSAVQANYKNNGPHERLHLFQASIYDLPFAPAQFDKVICVGVLQHTPDVKKSVQSLISMVKPGGDLVIDFYPVKAWYSKINAKYLLRPFTKKMNHDRLLSLIRANAGWMISAYNFFEKIGVGKFVNRFIPICDIKRTIPSNLPYEQLKEWVVLDTFDMFSPEYDQPQKLSTMKKYLEQGGFGKVEAEFVNYAEDFIAATIRGLSKK
ncbi:MAG: class I SAM-dependent methyltransferase [Bacteroidetes bacterium]|nr:class I SAM-dependent methyltransferase [Bacteroidota bacterium]